MESKGGSSGGSESKPHQYDVFINHRGPDVKKAFVAHLDAALRRDGFRPFLDGKDIGHGRHIFSTIDQALKGSCVHLAIFSKRYAESKYCLDELCDMLRSEQVTLPVFYHVDPLDLRWIENGPFKEGFEKHVQRGRTEKVEKWKEALCKVADYRGFRLDEVNGNEELLIRSILVEVRRLMPQDVLPGKQRYGMTESINNVLKTLESVNVLGLVGMGGIGKTTLAMEIYNRFVLRRQFKQYCFLKDVRSSDQYQLQQNLLKDLGHRSEQQNISVQQYGRILDALICNNVLIIVDDIDHSSQLSALIPDIKNLGSGSRIVITSREGDVLKHAIAGAASKGVYDVPLLNARDSRHLFNRHAFLGETPSEGYADLAVKVADACGGHALSLEIVGASLFDKKEPEDREIWLESVKALQENKDVFGKLRSTYDNLPTNGDRAMFRDIACMLIGMEKDVALTIWKSCGSCGEAHCSTSKTPASVLRRLMDRSLVKMDSDGRLRMHDVLRDMGRDIVKGEARGAEERSHVWDAVCATKVLARRKRNTIIRGMNLAVGAGLTSLKSDAALASIRDGSASCEVSQLTSMEELHFLRLDGCHVVVPDGFPSWPQELRWLSWRRCCFSTLPSHLRLPNLVVLDLSSSKELTRLWENDAHVQLPVLEMLDLTRCWRLEELAENVGRSVPKLKRLVMRWCDSLQRLPKSIGHLKDLEHLDLHYCRILVMLPDAICDLATLRTLILGCCGALRQLPAEFGKLTNLETLDIMDCSSLSDLPASFCGLRMLKTLNMYRTGVVHLPAEIGLLRSLTSLSMHGLRSLPKTFHRLQALTSLDITGGSADMDELGTFAALKHIDLMAHATITTLPRSVGNLKWLVSLNMSGCPELLTVEALPEGLKELNLSECRKLTEITCLAVMRCLVWLNLRNCKSLRHMHGLECVTTLEKVDVSGCSSSEGCKIDGMVNRSLRQCYVSKSKVGVAYNNRWLEWEPSEQSIHCLGNAIPVLPNGMGEECCLTSTEWILVLEATISSKAECIALIWCLAVSSSEMMKSLYTSFTVDLKVEVWRSGRLVTESSMNPHISHGGGKNVLMYTLGREHPVVQSLELGAQICVLSSMVGATGSSLSKKDKKGPTVLEGGICVVHNEDERLILAVNSEVLSPSQSADLALQFGQLVLKDKEE